MEPGSFFGKKGIKLLTFFIPYMSNWYRVGLRDAVPELPTLMYCVIYTQIRRFAGVYIHLKVNHCHECTFDTWNLHSRL